MKKPEFSVLDLVSKGDNQAIVIKAPYQKGEDWMMVINERLFGRFDRFEWNNQEVNASEYNLISRGFVGRIKRMKRLSTPAVVVGVVLLTILFFGGWISGNYNGLVGSRNVVDNSWAKVETSYQRRFDMIGNLVESVKGSQLQEQKVFKDIADGRKQYNSAQQSGDQEGQAQAASKIETNVALIPRLQEAYPELKSNDNIKSLMTEITGTENGIQSARNSYNDVVTDYNTNITRFPKNIFAGLFNFEKRSLFKSDTAASKAPQVKFSGGN